MKTILALCIATGAVVGASAPRLSDLWSASAIETVTIVERSDRHFSPRCASDAVGETIKLALMGETDD